MYLQIKGDLQITTKNVSSGPQAAVIANSVGNGRCILYDDSENQYYFMRNGNGYGEWVRIEEVADESIHLPRIAGL